MLSTKYEDLVPSFPTMTLGSLQVCGWFWWQLLRSCIIFRKRCKLPINLEHLSIPIFSIVMTSEHFNDLSQPSFPGLVPRVGQRQDSRRPEGLPPNDESQGRPAKLLPAALICFFNQTLGCGYSFMAFTTKLQQNIIPDHLYINTLCCRVYLYLNWSIGYYIIGWTNMR